jgi:NADH-quinone oxidoreductase subunit N
MENMVMDLSAISAEIAIAATGLLILLADLFTKENQKILLAVIAVVGILVAGFLTFTQYDNTLTGRVLYEQTEEGLDQIYAGAQTDIGFEGDGAVIVDNFSVIFRYIFLLSLLLTVILSTNYLRREEMEAGEYFALLFFCTLGMMVMASAADFITLFIGLETLSIPVYALAGYQKNRIRSNEASLKYLIMGAFASSFLLYGIAFIYGATGSIRFHVIGDILSAQGASLAPDLNLYLLIGIALLFIGFAFKISAVPFHMWTPDVYQGAPTPITAFMSVAVKAAAFAGLLRVFLILVPFEQLMAVVAEAGWWLAVLTMFVGNVVALSQKNIKRMLAYSSIAHAGYLLIGVLAVLKISSAEADISAAGQSAVGSVVFYLISYLLMNMGAFTIVILVSRKGDKFETIDDFAGLAKRHPGLALAMTVFLLSLAGFPPTAGFFGKFYIFASAISAGMIPLVIIAVINSLISVFYYLGPVVAMYFKEDSEDNESRPAIRFNLGAEFVLYFTFLAVLLIGIMPSRILALVNSIVAIRM